MPRLVPVLFAAVSSLALSACSGSGRFDSFPGFGGGSRIAAAPEPEPAPMAIPRTGAVTSEPLPPPSYPGGGPATIPGQGPSTTIGGAPVNPQVSGLPPTTPGAYPPTAAPGSPVGTGLPPVASAPPPAPPAPPSSSTRLAAVGTWTAREATGGSCRVTLSSASSLDLYRASASGCENKDLQRINAWKQEGNEIYLYSAGSVVARMPAGGASMSGALSRSGAPITLSR
ncbi:AprI/Inh family metalloprotease inhibitor [Terrarubrum flagellatum]|uniref:AprI/Inh family metalloprotease inhibitor n=1 Tax=Terrirubrum flagellatum TaxID=2895980 RepID=UPI003145046C